MNKKSQNGYNSKIVNTSVKYEHGDSAQILKEKYEDKKFDLIITSPPYNVGHQLQDFLPFHFPNIQISYLLYHDEYF